MRQTLQQRVRQSEEPGLGQGFGQAARPSLGELLRSTRLTAVLAWIGLVAAVLLGSWWTAQAVAAGAMASVLLRLALSVGGGTYYLVMFRVARRKDAGAYHV